MLVVKAITTRPTWYTACEPTSISKLLCILTDVGVLHVSVCFWNSIAFLAIKHKDTSFFFYISEKLWRDVEHIISVRPSSCNCPMCDWRIKRQRYLHVQVFEHVFLKRW